METAVVLVNRCLRVHDHPALALAAEQADQVVPLFVYDEALLALPFAAPNRLGFLHEALGDLRATLRARGGDLIVRRGDPAAEAVHVARRVEAATVYGTADVTGYAARRGQRLAELADRAGIAVHLTPGVSVVEPGTVHPHGGDAYRVFTPFHRAWSRAPWRAPREPPSHVRLPPGLAHGALPRPPRRDAQSPQRAPGGESAGRRRLAAWSRASLAGYPASHDLVAQDATSRLSPYFHLGCLSPLEVAVRLGDRPGGDAFVRQLCWRDFHHQIAATFPRLPRDDYRPRGDRWLADRRADELFARWADGETGYPLVDAGMRQLRREGWLPNRVRMAVASFLTKDLRIDWRRGAAHFLWWLVDGDVVQNAANWQWVAGTGTDTRPNRVLNPHRQAERFDPGGDYIRRHVPELADLDGRAARRPWTLDDARRRALGYPAPVIDHAVASARFRSSRRS